MDLKSTYNKIAKDWMKDHHSDTWWVEVTDKYSTYFEPGATILDIGCGAGTKSKYLIDKEFDVTGIDFSQAMIDLASEQVPVGKFLVKDIKQLLGFDAIFDGVFAQAVLLHIPKNEIIGVLNNITTPLKSGGFLYVAVKEVKLNGKDEEIVKENDYGYDYERFFNYFTLDGLKKNIEKIGLKVYHL